MLSVDCWVLLGWQTQVESYVGQARIQNSIRGSNFTPFLNGSRLFECKNGNFRFWPKSPKNQRVVKDFFFWLCAWSEYHKVFPENWAKSALLRWEAQIRGGYPPFVSTSERDTFVPTWCSKHFSCQDSGFLTALEYADKRKQCFRIATGSQELE